MERSKRWMVLRNGIPVGLSPPNPLTEAAARMLAEVLSNETPEDDFAVVAWSSDESETVDSEPDTVVRFRNGSQVVA